MKRSRALKERRSEISGITERTASIVAIATDAAHEINNPLATVILNLDFATTALTGAGAAGHVRQALDALRDAREAAERIRVVVKHLQLAVRARDEG